MESIVDWTPENIGAAVPILTKIRDTFAAGRHLPLAVYEAWVQTFKKISTMVVIFDTSGRIYLAYRPENPLDPYSGQLDLPGVTHLPFEYGGEALQRLMQSEVGQSTRLDGPHLVGTLENNEPVRGLYQFHIHIARLVGDMMVEKDGVFYPIQLIPWDALVKSHRDVVVPIALAHARARGWVE